MSVLAELLDVEDATWRRQAACRGVDPSIFFPPDDGGRVRSSVYAKARSICASCPVRLACLKEHADELHGCWGGTSPKERQDLRHQRELQLRASKKAARTLPHVVGCDNAVRSGA